MTDQPSCKLKTLYREVSVEEATVEISQKGLGDRGLRGGPTEPGTRRLGGGLIQSRPEECPGPPTALPPPPPSSMGPPGTDQEEVPLSKTLHLHPSGTRHNILILLEQEILLPLARELL